MKLTIGKKSIQMNSKPKIIYEKDQPAFAVIPYQDYLNLIGNNKGIEKEFLPFALKDYIQNPIRLARIEANLSQQDLAAKLNVTQGYVSKIECPSYKVSEKLLHKINTLLIK